MIGHYIGRDRKRDSLLSVLTVHHDECSTCCCCVIKCLLICYTFAEIYVIISHNGNGNGNGNDNDNMSCNWFNMHSELELHPARARECKGTTTVNMHHVHCIEHAVQM